MIDKAEWRADAFNAAVRWIRSQPADRTPRNFESIRLQVARSAKRLDEPTDARWWGAVCRSLIREGLLRPVPVSKPARSSHYALKRCYWVG